MAKHVEPIVPPFDISPGGGTSPNNGSPNNGSTGLFKDNKDPQHNLKNTRARTKAVSYAGLSLHQGSMPFVSLNGIHITFSPMLLGTIGVSSLFSVMTVQSYPESIIFPLLLVLLFFSQLAGNLLTGLLLALRPQSLILSFSGVIDPDLIVRRKTLTEGSIDRLAPIRALGSSLTTALFLAALENSPMKDLLPQEPILLSSFWAFASFLVIAPFLPPHRMSDRFKDRLIEGILPVTFFSVALFMLHDSVPFSFGIEQFFFFTVVVLLRKFWWSRISLVSELAQEITLRDAMLPIKNLEVLHHGLTISSAQKIAMQHSQTIFPVISGNRLTGYIEREELFRTPFIDNEEPFVSSLSEKSISFASPCSKLEACFEPDVPLPLFIIEEDETTGDQITGIVTAEQVQNSLLIALGNHSNFDSSD